MGKFERNKDLYKDIIYQKNLYKYEFHLLI